MHHLPCCRMSSKRCWSAGMLHQRAGLLHGSYAASPAELQLVLPVVLSAVLILAFSLCA